MTDVTPHTYVPKDALSLWWLGDPAQPKPIGIISLQDRGRRVGLRYGAQWLAGGFALSEDLPLVAQLFLPAEQDAAAGALDDARPDRWGERVIRKFEATRRLSLLEYLLFAGADRYGALGVSQSESAWEPWQRGPVPVFSQLDEMAEAVRKVIADEPVPELQRRLVKPGASLGGARPKSLIQMEGTEWLVKFPENEDMDVPLVEHAAMGLARRCGIDAATTRALKLAGGHAVAIERFDRRSGTRVHAVSAHVALRAAGAGLSYPDLSQLLRRLAPAVSVAAQQEELFRRMVFNILIDNTDDHEKNHALLRHPDGSYLLAPAFDVVPTAQGLGYQMLKVGNQGNESSLDNAMSACAQFGLKVNSARAVVAQVCECVAKWKAHFRKVGVTDNDIQLLESFIDRDVLRQQRAAFK